MTGTFELNPRKDRHVGRMAFACFFGLGGFIAWGSLAPLEEGVAAHGKIVVESNRQTIQHLEGGIVHELRVREGDKVTAGDVLVVLQDTTSLAGRDQVIQQYAALMASTERLSALKEGARAPDFSMLESLELGDLERDDIVSREASLFEQQKESLQADLAVLSSRIEAAKTVQNSRDHEIEIVEARS